MRELGIHRNQNTIIYSTGQYWKRKATQRGDSFRYLETGPPWDLNCWSLHSCKEILCTAREGATQKEKGGNQGALHARGFTCILVCILITSTSQSRETLRAVEEYSEGFCFSSWATLDWRLLWSCLIKLKSKPWKDKMPPNNFFVSQNQVQDYL